MKFITFVHNDRQQVGVLREERVFPIKELGFSPDSMLDLIVAFQPEWLDRIEGGLKGKQTAGLPISAVTLLAPIPYPCRNVICLGKNYAEHAREVGFSKLSGTGIPEQPIYFTKIASPAAADGEIICISRAVTEQVDYEAELAVVVGQGGKNIRPEQAWEHIFGYTVANDLSARNLQAGHKQWFKGKSLDGFCPLGPALVHKSAVPWPVHLQIQCRVNGELRQDSDTSRMLFDIPYIISDLSRGMTLQAGDIICTGTPAGVGMGFDPPRFLQHNDVVECFIEKVGTLTNRIAFTE